MSVTKDANMTAKIRGPVSKKGEMLKTVKNVIAVASGKGGVAKSTTVANLALALKQTGAKVGVLDADIYGPSIPTMLLVDDEPGLADDNKLLIPAMSNGMEVISMGFFLPPNQAAIMRGPMVHQYIMQFLGNVKWGELDYLIIDYPPGTGDVQLTLSQNAPITGAIVCTTPQGISLIDVGKAISMFESTEVPVLGIVETMSYFICDQCGKRHNIFSAGGGEHIAKQTGVPLLATIPIDPLVTESSDSGKPIVISNPESPAAEAYRNLAAQVASRLSHMGQIQK